MRQRPLIHLAAVAAITMSFTVVGSMTSSVGAAPVGIAGEAPADGSATDQIIVTYDGPDGRVEQSALTADAGDGARTLRDFGSRSEVVKLPSALSGPALERIMQKLAQRPGVVAVEADQIMRLTDDPLADQQWDLTDPAESGVQGIDLDDAWTITTGSTGIRVAVLDTGILDHEDLAGRYVGGYDFISDARIGNDGNGRDSNALDPGDWVTSQEASGGFFQGCQVRDSSWHGTHVAGTIGAATNNGVGMAGINQVSQIVPIRVLGKCGGFTSDIVDGMRWAAGLPVGGVPDNPNPAQVLSLSLGGGGACSSVYQNAIDDIRAAGAVVVVAAGNSDADAAGFSPASCSGVVTVAATGKAGDRAYYSNFGSTVEIAAPGGDRLADGGDTILSTLDTGTRGPSADTYVRYQGTSMATPHVSGVVSLMLSADPGLSPAEIDQLLASSARPFPTGSSCAGVCGAGLLDAGAAVAAANGGPGTTTTTTTPASTTTVATADFGKVAPSNGQTRLSTRVRFSWETAPGASGYEVCLDRIVNGQCDGSWQPISGTAATGRLSRRTTYEWQVRAVGGSAGEADSGQFWSFSTR